MEEAILGALKARPGEFVSGEELSRLVGVSRAAVWKEIEKLRGQGYRIAAQPHAGYRLVSVPDRLLPQELSWGLETRRIGRRIQSYEATDSTMDVAHRLAAAGEPEGTVVFAEGQTRGRGRLGRTWSSPRGKGIYLSVILRPPLALSQAAHVTLTAAVAVTRAIRAETPLEPQIKWPNDVTLRGRKVAGILTELAAELNRVHYVILGVGLNVNTAGSALPAHGTSLAQELGERVDRVGLARRLLSELDQSYAKLLDGGIGPILAEWRGHAHFLGSRVRVAAEDRTVDGQAVDVDENGSLLVRTDAGTVETVSAGDVIVVR